jgi:nickel/cobalt transporter (NicO) family protein
MNPSLALGLGFVLGVRHATDADHIAAVGTMLRRDGGLRGALRTGALWGVGHSATVTAVGVAIVAFRVEFSPGVVRAMELAVAAMLLGLGATNLAALRGRDVADGAAYAGAGVALRPVAVGLVHGLAGSAGVALLALATIRSTAGAVAYLALFDLGTVAGMALLTGLLALPLTLTARRARRLYTALVATASLASVATGCVVALEALGA